MTHLDAPKAATWAHEPERSNALALRVMVWIALRLGRRIARGVLVLIAIYFLLTARRPRRASRAYLERALGRPANWADLYRHVHTFAATILDRVYFLRGHTGWLSLNLRGIDDLEAVLARGRGGFLVGAHFGSFELLRAAGMQIRGGLRIAMAMFPDNARKINAALAAIAPDAAPEVIALGRPESMLAVREYLDHGGLVGLLADRSLPQESERGQRVRLPFLGSEVEFSDGPFRLAALLRQQVVFMAGVYHGGGAYEMRMTPLADFSERPADAAAREQQIRQALAAYVAHLESLCREAPYNWFNFYDFWCESDT